MAGNDEDTVMTSKAADANGGGGIVAMRNPRAKENRGPHHHIYIHICICIYVYRESILVETRKKKLQ